MYNLNKHVEDFIFQIYIMISSDNKIIKFSKKLINVLCLERQRWTTVNIAV